MPSSKKRPADEAFVEHEPATPKAKKRRQKDKSKLRLKDEELTDAPAWTPPEEPTPREDFFQISALKTETEPSPEVDLKAEHTAKEVARLAQGRQKPDKKHKKSKQTRDLVKSETHHIGSYAVIKRDAKKSPKKPKASCWSLSQSIGGIFIDQDPILVDRDQYLILPTAGGIQVYSTKTSLLVRTLHVSENDPVTSCVLDPDHSSHVFLSRLSGMVQLWDWTKGQRQEQWRCQKHLLKITAVVTESPSQYKVLTIHGALDEEIKLVQSFLSKSSILPDAEVLLLSKQGHWSGCKSVDNANVMFLSFGKQLVIGQLLPVSKASNEKAYTWREVKVPQPIESMDIKIRERPKTAGSGPAKMIDVVIGCIDGVIIMYEDLLYRLIGREKGMKDVEISSRRVHWHRQEVNTVRWSRDGNYLVSGGNETVLVIWQLDTNQQQFLPHLSSPILNLTISDLGSSYVLRLADNSVMVLSTADLLPSANISGLALLDDPAHPALASLSARDPDQLLLAVHADPLSNEASSTTMLQTFDTRTARQVSRQALARNLTTELRFAPDGGKVHEPNVSHLRTSHDGNWLVTVDEWRPKPHDLDAIHSDEYGQVERLRSVETCLRFWKWQEEASTWELVTRVDEPHLSCKRSVLDLAMHPTKLEASTIGLDGMLRRWSPMARYRDGVAVKDKSGHALYTWMCSKTVRLEPEPPTLNTIKETSAAMAYSEDGSVVAASWSWSDLTHRVVHIVNARTAQLRVTQANILSAGPAQLAFSGRYLLALSDNFCIWDTVALKKVYSITLRHASRDGKFLAANANDGTFALAFDLRQPMELSSVVVFDGSNPHKGPLHQGKVYGHVRVLLPHMKSSGYLIFDSNARLRHLTPPGAVRSMGSTAIATTEDAAKGLKDIFGARSANASKLEDGTGPAGQLMTSSTESNMEQRTLNGIQSSTTSSRLPSVRQMFEQVFTGPVAASQANPPPTTQSLLAVPPQHLMPPEVVLLGNSSSPHDAKDFGTISDPKPSSLPATLEAERALLWQRAYEEVRKENATLISDYEAILASVSNAPIQDAKTNPLPNQLEAMQHVVDFQQQRMLNKQWTWSMFGSNTKIRDTVDGIMKLVVDSSALISVGMTLAPPYVSLPWSAISALIPLIANNSSEQRAAIDGLESITKFLFSYRIAEETFLVDETTKSAFIDSVLPLYKGILMYQATSATYFGRKTLTRMGGDIFAGTRWQDTLSSVREEEIHSRTSTQFLGNQDLKKILAEQAALLKDLPLRLSSKRAEAGQVMHWTSQIPFYSDHCQVKAVIGAPSDQWLTKEDDYLLWKTESSPQVFFLEGTVGQGKTSLVCGVIEDILQQADSHLAFFYCSRNSSTKIEEAGATRRDKSVNCFRSVLAQFGTLDDHNAPSQALMKQYHASYNQLPGGCTLSFEDSLNLIVEIIEEDREQSRILVIDALDECRDSKQLLKGLHHLTERCSRLKILISSREGFLDSMEKLFSSLKAFKIENKNAEDMNNYIHQEVQNRSGDSGFSPEQAIRLETFLRARASGMFRWVVLNLDIILPTDVQAKPRLSEDIDAQILELETTFDRANMLTSAYQEIFRGATGGGRAKTQYEVICAALKWVLCSFRSFTAKELAYASSISPDGTRRKGVSEDFLLANCANLLVEREYVGVAFAHLSVAEFLKNTMPELFSLPKAHAVAAVSCLLLVNPSGASDHLRPTASFTDTRPWSQSTQSQVRLPKNIGRVQKLSMAQSPGWRISPRVGASNIGQFLEDYASLYWPVHCREAERDSRLKELIPPTEYVRLHDIIRKSNHDALRAAIAAKDDLNPADLDGNTALHKAVELEDRESLLVLILAGADCETPNFLCQSPLHTAAFNNDPESLRLLVYAGADKNPRDLAGATPLHYAAYHGNAEALRYLIAVGARIDLLDHRDKSAADNQSKFLGPDEWPSGNPLIEWESDPPFKTAFLQKDQKLKVLGNLCFHCNIPQWMDAPSKDKTPHWSSLARLRASADEGCELCIIFSEGLSCQPEVRDHWYDTQIWTKITTSYISADSRDNITAFLGSIATYEVEMCQDPEQPLQFQLTSVVVDQNSDSARTFSKIQSWMRCCDTSHLECKVKVEASGLPKRLIDIANENQDKVYQVLGSDLIAKRRQPGPGSDGAFPGDEIEYAFLSHRFGEKLVPASAVKLQEDAKKSILVTELDQTLQDVIVILRRLGMRYLWVDKLCIDWITPETEGMRGYQSREIDKLAQYVANAALVINAGSYLDGEGIFHERPHAHNLLELSCSVESQDGTKTGKLCFREPMRSAAWVFSDFLSSRAWILQEITLPKRVVIFGSDQVYWKCHTDVRSEGSLEKLTPALDFPPFTVYDGADVQLFDRWYKMVEVLSSKEISFFNDKIMAVQGMAERTKAYLRAPAYRGALWEGDWHRGLLWYSSAHAHAQRPHDVELPTWSWASLDGPVSYSLLHALIGIAKDDPLTVEISEWQDPDHNLEFLEISGALSKLVDINSKDQACQLLFDTLEDEENWCDGLEYYAVLINRWSPEGSEEYFRWVGLLLGVKTDLGGVYTRQWNRHGVVLGPWSDNDLGGWCRERFHIAGDGILRGVSHEQRATLQERALEMHISPG